MKETNNIVIAVEHVSKKFCRHLRRSMAYGIADLTKNLLGIKPDTTKLRKAEFWALDDVSFTLRQGDRLGIIGVNGSGKTTLLRLLTGIFPPDKGEMRLKGRIGALVAVGAGFHPHMTGRENIYLNGTLLGMNRDEIDAKFEQIVEFSEIGDFLEAPISAYSSGMRVRLGFAIAVHCDPDILLVDEILSVGDLRFRNKSLRRMYEHRERANAIIFVSHQLEQVRALCNRVIILDKGKIVFDGATHEGCAQYEEMIREGSFNASDREPSLIHDSRVKKRLSSFEEFDLLDVGILDAQHQKTEKIRMDESLTIYWDFKVKKSIDDIYFNAGVWNEKNVECIWVTSKDDTKVQFPSLEPGNYRIVIDIPEHRLVPNIYMPSIFIRSDKTGETYERIWSNSAFQVVTDGNTLGAGVISTQANWEVIQLRQRV
jgi:lipopolysaccharide transport system ATP-binding protein